MTDLHLSQLAMSHDALFAHDLIRAGVHDAVCRVTGEVHACMIHAVVK